MKSLLNWIKRNDFKIFFVFILAILLIIFMINENQRKAKVIRVKEGDVISVTVNCPHHTDTLSMDNLKKLIERTNIEHPEIVLAQCRLESGNLESALTTSNNNFLGMKHANKRPTTSVGEKNGYANFIKWQDCVYDYMIWQSRYAKKLSEDEYFNYLSENYATDSTYVEKLKQIINE